MHDSYEIAISSFIYRYLSLNMLISVLIAFRIKSGQKLRDRGNQFTNLFLQLGDAALFINKEIKLNDFLEKPIKQESN